MSKQKKKKDFTYSLFWTFELAELLDDLDVALIRFYFQVPIFGIQLQIKSDLYLCVERSVLYRNASHKMISCFTNYSFNFLLSSEAKILNCVMAT